MENRLTAFMAEVEKNAKLKAQLQQAESRQGFIKIALEAGFELTAEDLDALINTGSELSEDDLNEVAGGTAHVYNPFTYFKNLKKW